jgi:4-hydroxybenzoate polyprenyltransferase/phosphoserine phosphatase
MKHEQPVAAATAVPLVVDLDGTLTPADVSVEALLKVARQGVRQFFMVLFWLFAGRAGVKVRGARHAPLDATALLYRPEVMDLIDQARSEGRPVILASASHRRNIARVARHLGCFDATLATGHRANLKGKAKLAALRAMLGDQPFDYVGDSKADRPLWAAARRGYTVRTNHPGVERLTARSRPKWRVLLKAMRPHQWAKNALIFVPVLTADRLFHVPSLVAASLAFVLMSLVASGVYLLNDALDVDADRKHPTKFKRPIASGDLSIPLALALSVVFTVAPIVIGLAVLGWREAAALTVYLVLTTGYSFRVKSAMTADVITLACLYTIRLWIGALAIGVGLSFWLLLFSVFFFLSLAYLKRYTELSVAIDPKKLLSGRGYVGADLEIVGQMGVASGMVSILVLALFANAIRETGQYAAPQLLWLLTLPLLYWINRVWMMARRGQVDGDPIAFAISDKRSLVLAASMAVILVAAKSLPLQL